MNNHEEGLIQQYVHAIQALGVRAESGEDVTAAIASKVKEAVDHFRIVKSSDPLANLLAFKGRLKIVAEATHSSQPSFKETLRQAADICPNDI